MADPMIPLGDAISRGSIFMRDGECELTKIDATLRQLVRRREAEIADIKKQAADAQTDEATEVLKDCIERWRIDKWDARVDSVRRLLKAGNISAHGRQALGKDREPIIDAAWERAIPHGAEHNDLSFGRGPEWFDVVIVDANRDTVPVNGTDSIDSRYSQASDAVVLAALWTVYLPHKASADGPNVKAVVDPVLKVLRDNGAWSSKNRITDLAGRPEFQGCRRRRGERLRTPG